MKNLLEYIKNFRDEDEKRHPFLKFLEINDDCTGYHSNLLARDVTIYSLSGISYLEELSREIVMQTNNRALINKDSWHHESITSDGNRADSLNDDIESKILISVVEFKTSKALGSKKSDIKKNLADAFNQIQHKYIDVDTKADGKYSNTDEVFACVVAVDIEKIVINPELWNYAYKYISDYGNATGKASDSLTALAISSIYKNNKGFDEDMNIGFDETGILEFDANVLKKELAEFISNLINIKDEYDFSWISDLGNNKQDNVLKDEIMIASNSIGPTLSGFEIIDKVINYKN